MLPPNLLGRNIMIEDKLHVKILGIQRWRPRLAYGYFRCSSGRPRRPGLVLGCVSNASMTTRLHSERSCAIMLSVCASVRHHSLMSSIHSLLALPLLFSPSMIPNTTFFTNRLSYMLQICPNSLSFLSMISCITIFFDVKPLSYQYIRYFLLPVYVENSSVTFHFKCHQQVYVSLPQRPGLTSI